MRKARQAVQLDIHVPTCVRGLMIVIEQLCVGWCRYGMSLMSGRRWIIGAEPESAFSNPHLQNHF